VLMRDEKEMMWSTRGLGSALQFKATHFSIHREMADMTH
jgi:hypothetical protein